MSRLGRSGSGSPDSMSSSYHGNTSATSSMHNDVNTLIQMSASLMENVKSDQSIMVQSLDPTILSNASMKSNSSLNEAASVRSVIPQLNGMHEFISHTHTQVYDYKLNASFCKLYNHVVSF